MEKGIFVSSNNFIDDTASGGKKCAKRNFELFREVLGRENTILFIVSNDFSEDEEMIWEGSRTYKIAGCANKKESIINYSKGYNVMTPRAEKIFMELAVNEKISYLFSDSSIFGRTIEKAKKAVVGIKTICFMHNIEKWYGWNRVVHENPLYITYYHASYYNEKRAMKYADRVISLTERDQESTFKLYGRKTDMILPITFKDVYNKNCNATKKAGDSFLFVGSLFQPNVEGITWLVEKVMPNCPYQIKIVGRGLETLRHKLERDNVQVIGGVGDLAAYYEEAVGIILPIFYGDGMKVKTAEAMMYGKRIIAADEALVGYDVQGQQDIYRCNTPQEFLNAMEQVYAKRDVTFSENVRQLFLDKYENSSYLEPMRKLMEEI